MASNVNTTKQEDGYNHLIFPSRDIMLTSDGCETVGPLEIWLVLTATSQTLRGKNPKLLPPSPPASTVVSCS